MGTVSLYATLRQRVGGVRDVEVPWQPGDNALDIIHELLRLHPRLAGYIIGEDDQLLPYVSVFLDGRDVRYLGGLKTPVSPGTVISIFPPVAGGV